MPLRIRAISFAWIGLAGLIGCGRPDDQSVIAETPVQIRTWNALAPCPANDAELTLIFSVHDSHGEIHTESFFVRLRTVLENDSTYHPGGFASADGPRGGYNRSCYIEDSTATGIAIRFRLTSRQESENVSIDELIWVTARRATTVELPHGCTARITFREAT